MRLLLKLSWIVIEILCTIPKKYSKRKKVIKNAQSWNSLIFYMPLCASICCADIQENNIKIELSLLSKCTYIFYAADIWATWCSSIFFFFLKCCDFSICHLAAGVKTLTPSVMPLTDQHTHWRYQSQDNI